VNGPGIYGLSCGEDPVDLLWRVNVHPGIGTLETLDVCFGKETLGVGSQAAPERHDLESVRVDGLDTLDVLRCTIADDHDNKFVGHEGQLRLL
jgi:hypothetical protein